MKIAKTRDVKTPVRGTSQSAGLDFFIPNDYQARILVPGEDVSIPSGIYVCLPKDTVLIALEKSGQATKKNIQVGAKVIDEDYQGEVHLHVRNTGNHDITIEPGEKIVQMVLLPVIYTSVDEVLLSDLYDEVTQRGAGGFGSTGLK